ncbi:MAG TPA: FAD-dependent oxidoreductase [Casimicrobiaceae bacterium]|nr:FAD-dependent oxidoreductase [Casimicrobiaceae bacterium]
MSMLKLGLGLSFGDLYSIAGLAHVDAGFVAQLGEADPSLLARLQAARRQPDSLGRAGESDLLMAIAPFVEDFVGRLFAIESEVAALQEAQHELAPLFACKRQVVQRKALNRYKADIAESFDGAALRSQLEAKIGATLTGIAGELAYARAVGEWGRDEAAHAPDIDLALRYAAWAVHTAEGKSLHKAGVLFKAPRKLDFMRLIPVEHEHRHGVDMWRLPPSHLRRREGFALTDPGTDLAGGLDQAHYCIWCHEQQKDSCSSGMREKKPADGSAAAFKKSPFGVILAGCPLEEKISEFHKLRADGLALAALAMICVDNPLVAATGHRICNDCMKACIYQKQDPVDIPQSETRVLKDVLALPWGFEIYALLTRWNPLNLRRPLPLEPTGKRVLVVGMGPAGFTLAHHLLNDGHTVVGIDGLKIEPLAPSLSGVTASGERVAFAPVHDIATLRESLDDRVMAGFGGVAEYGITVRWDKNFLKLIRLLLERRERFALFGGVRFGGTIDAAGGLALGFDHIALCAGAGKPTVLELPNGLANGVRTASDFLMALQLTGAAKLGSLANMQLRLPVVVVGGGLTAIDTATESLAYYPVQVEKFLARHEQLVAEEGIGAVEAGWTTAEREIALEYLSHARAIRAERATAQREGRPARIFELLDGWGGVTIAYRRRLIDSPSYTLNHEEVEKALEEGVRFAEGLTPLAVETDASGRACALAVSVQHDDGDAVWHEVGRARLPARTILVAAGTHPNTIAAREDPLHFHLDGRHFQALDEKGQPVKLERGLAKPPAVHVLTSLEPDGRAVSFFGDLHPSFFGNVVKAMASATAGYRIVSRMLARRTAASRVSDDAFLAALNDQLRARVERVERLTPTIVEVVVRAPAAARRFAPGQFYRLQNFETFAAKHDGTRLAMEGIALTGAWVDREQGLVSTIVLEMGGSSDLCAQLEPGEPVVLMGPTGTPSEIRPNETVILAGGGLGNAVLFSIGQAFRQAGSRVLYFAGYRKMVDRYKVADIEAAADAVVWCCDEGPGFTADRAQDRSFVGNIVQAMTAYAEGKLGEQAIRFADADRLIAIGSDRMMAAVAAARSGILAAHLKPQCRAIASINSPMQCMMKEICAQCLQPHRDPVTGKVSYVFSCFNQDQAMDVVDFSGLAVRLEQNTVQEKLTARWIEHCLRVPQPIRDTTGM